jgi:hypothetical protein
MNGMISQNGFKRFIDGHWYLCKVKHYICPIVHTAVVGATANGNINIDVNSDFILTDQHLTDTNDPTVAAPGLQGQYEFSISIQDSSNGYNWQNDYVPRAAFARDRAHGYRLPDEVLIAKNTKLTVTIRNPAAGAAVGTTTLDLQGYSLYLIQ